MIAYVLSGYLVSLCNVPILAQYYFPGRLWRFQGVMEGVGGGRGGVVVIYYAGCLSNYSIKNIILNKPGIVAFRVLQSDAFVSSPQDHNGNRQNVLAY